MFDNVFILLIVNSIYYIKDNTATEYDISVYFTYLLYG